MKKMTFALACASAVAAFAAAEDSAVISSINFDAYTAGFTGLDLKKDDGSQGAVTDSRWLYLGASGSTDASTVKAYVPADDSNPNYLELSTEGGTLWRSINNLAASDSEESGAALGAAQAVPADTGLYIDTMVQFTPTEDGGDPTLDPTTDKLAIWLNVKDNVTNLCVRTKAIARPGYVPSSGEYADGAWSQTEKTIVLSGEYSASTWYRLTVQAVKSVTSHADAEVIPGFIISIDGNPVTASEQLVGDDAISYLNDDGAGGFTAGWVSEDNIDLIRSKKFIPSLAGVQDSGSATVLQAVGFKGSGAIDSLQFTTQDPGGEDPAPVVKEVDLTISAGNATVTGITDGKVEVGSNLTFTVTAAEGYNLTGVTINGTTVTADADGNYTYTVADTDEAVAVVVTTEAIPSIDWNNPKAESGTATEMFGITGALATADGQKLAAWAQNVGKVSFDKASEIKTDAFLLNCANTDDAITAAKANFKIVSIEQNDQGAWVAKVTDGVGDGGEFGNGYVEIKGSATVDGTYNLATTAETARFFKAFLVLEAPATK